MFNCAWCGERIVEYPTGRWYHRHDRWGDHLRCHGSGPDAEPEYGQIRVV